MSKDEIIARIHELDPLLWEGSEEDQERVQAEYQELEYQLNEIIIEEEKLYWV